MNQTLMVVLVVAAVLLALCLLRCRGLLRSFRREFQKVRQDLLDKSVHPNCAAFTGQIGSVIQMLERLANAGDKTVRRTIPSRRWKHLLDSPQWLDEILTAVGEQGFSWPIENQLKGLTKGVQQVHALVFRGGDEKF